jgi:hypothetical protein
MSDKLKPFKAWAIIDKRKISGFRIFKTRREAEKACKGGYVVRVFVIAVEEI